MLSFKSQILLLVVVVSAVAHGALTNTDIKKSLPKAKLVRIQNNVLQTELLKKLYSLRDYQPIWNEQARAAFDLVLDGIYRHGLKRSYYEPSVTVLNIENTITKLSSADLSQILAAGDASNQLLQNQQQSQDQSTDITQVNQPAQLTSQNQSLALDLKKLELEAELIYTDSAIRLASDLSTGRLNPKDIEPDVKFDKRKFGQQDLVDLNNILLTPENFIAGFDMLAPQFEQYKMFMSLMEQYNNLKANGDLPALTPKDKPEVYQERLHFLGYNNPDLTEAVKLFQFDHGIKVDGVFGRMSREKLNLSYHQRMEKIAANMERLRWLPKDLGPLFSFVNLATQTMKVYENGHVALDMKVVVGRDFRKTPILINRIQEVILNPTWTAPKSIAYKDVVKKILANPNHINEKHLKILDDKTEAEVVFNSNAEMLEAMRKINRFNVPYRFVQQPYYNNTLGVVKFMMTNRDAIFMHDTDHREDFEAQNNRLLSSGCIRLQKPLEFAEFVLRRTGEWPMERIQDYVAKGTADEIVNPENKIVIEPESKTGIADFKVYTIYLSVVREEDGRLRFMGDSYGQDAEILRGLKYSNPEGESL